MKKKLNVKIPITEEDIEMFKDLIYHNRSFEWEFSPDEDPEVLLNIKFITEDEE